jgi:phosphoribosylglycinamide formyltransferase-1
MDTAEIRERIAAICLHLPEIARDSPTGQHDVYTVRGKRFAYYLFDHHGDGRVSLEFRGAPGEQARLVAEDARRFFLPSYIARYGWVGLYLDLGSVDWDEAELFILDSYMLVAPRSLAARVGS